MTQQGGWEELFAPLGDEPKDAAPQQTPASTDDLSAELNAAFIAAAIAPESDPQPIAPTVSAPQEPSEPVAGWAPQGAAGTEFLLPGQQPAAQPPVLREPVLQEPVAEEQAAQQQASQESSAPQPLTRRALRELREHGETAAAAPGAAPTGNASPEPPVPGLEQAAQPAAFVDPTPVAAAPVAAPVAAPTADARAPQAPVAAAPAFQQPAAPDVPQAGAGGDLPPTQPYTPPQAAPAVVPAPVQAAPTGAAPSAPGIAPASQVPAPGIAPASQAPAPDLASLAAGGSGVPPVLTPRQAPDAGFPIPLRPSQTPPRRRSRRWLAWFIPLVLVLGGLAGAGAWAWTNYQEQICEEFEFLGCAPELDYEGAGNGEEVVVTIYAGDLGSDVAITLARAGVTKTFDAFYDLLLALAEEGQEPSFVPGNFRLQKEMSAEAALAALQDSANHVTSQVTIPEGSNLPQAIEILAEQTGIAAEEFTALSNQPQLFGIAEGVPTLEGYLFPATYELDGTETAESLLRRLVDETIARLDALGVAAENRNSFVTMASIVQKESGPVDGDMAKIARVFQNRIDQGMLLESDATTTYGTCVWGPANGREAPDTCGTVWLNQSDIDDTSNPYNTRANAGLPLGPISNPGQEALEAVANPAEGSWLFFVAVNLETGETVFTNTVEEHEAAVEQLYEWCESSDAAAAYCS